MTTTPTTMTRCLLCGDDHFTVHVEAELVVSEHFRDIARMWPATSTIEDVACANCGALAATDHPVRAKAKRAMDEIVRRAGPKRGEPVETEVRKVTWRWLVLDDEQVVERFAERAEADAYAERIKRYRVTADPSPVTERVLTCCNCGGTGFSYEEGTIDYRAGDEVSVADEDGGGLVSVYYTGADGDSGDSDPGLFCDDIRFGGCGCPIILPDGWDIDFQ